MSSEPNRTQPLEELLTSEQVAARYRLRELATARRIMREAGGFEVARKLLVSTSDLASWEAARRPRRDEATSEQIAQRRPAARRSAEAPRGRATSRTSSAPASDELSAGWWRA